MTEAEEWQRRVALASSGGKCEVCGQTLTTATWQGAHRIANTKPNRARWGNEIIDDPDNIAIVCSLGCNHLCNIGYNEGECWKLVLQIAQKKVKKYRS